MNNLIVHIPTNRSNEQIIDCAVSMTSIFKAHLDWISCVYQSSNPVLSFERAAAAIAIATEYDRGEELAAATLEKFQTAAKRAGISRGIRIICVRPYPARQTLAEISRLFDLSVIAQPHRAKPGPGDLIPETVLLSSGRPMLMVSHVHVGPPQLERVPICWNDGRPAAPTIHDAMPVLHNLKVIDVVAVNETDPTESEVSSAALVAHLARRDVPLDVQQLTADAFNIHTAILSLAADKGTDLIVMGGCGHAGFKSSSGAGLLAVYKISHRSGADLTLRLWRARVKYRSLMVYLDLGQSNESALRIACDLADRFKSRIIGATAGFRYMPIYLGDTDALDVREADCQQLNKAVARHEGRFRAALESVDGLCEWRSDAVSPADFLTSEARAADLLMVGRRENGIRFIPNQSLDIGDAIMRAGRPVCYPG